MKQKIPEFTGLMLAALVTGVFWGTWFTLTRSLENFSQAKFIHIGKIIISNVALPMRILIPTTLLVIHFVCGRHSEPVSFLLFVRFVFRFNAGYTVYNCWRRSTY